MVRVLLLKHVPNVGKEGQIVDLKDGYASNFIFPKNLGKKLTEADEKRLLDKRKQDEAKRIELVEKRHEIAEMVRGTKFSYKFKSS
jgi:large subunit ribosomal protein L9